jgi:hypothetical protein
MTMTMDGIFPRRRRDGVDAAMPLSPPTDDGDN